MISRSFVTLHALYLINIELLMKVKWNATKCSGRNIAFLSQKSLGFLLCKHCVTSVMCFPVGSSCSTVLVGSAGLGGEACRSPGLACPVGREYGQIYVYNPLCYVFSVDSAQCSRNTPEGWLTQFPGGRRSDPRGRDTFHLGWSL